MWGVWYLVVVCVWGGCLFYVYGCDSWPLVVQSCPLFDVSACHCVEQSTFGRCLRSMSMLPRRLRDRPCCFRRKDRVATSRSALSNHAPCFWPFATSSHSTTLNPKDAGSGRGGAGSPGMRFPTWEEQGPHVRNPTPNARRAVSLYGEGPKAMGTLEQS